ncbi:MAG: hypothetical protein ACOCRZ_01880 [Halothermotrichaceae bacterium]
MQKISLCLALMLILLGNTVVFAEDLSIDGSLENYYSVKINDSNELIGGSAKLQLDFGKSVDDIDFFASILAENNQIIKSKDEIKINEAYLEYIAPDWDIRVGRQFYSWGKADGIQITDILCPADNREFSSDFTESRIAVDSVKYRYLLPSADLELIWIPFFQEAKNPAAEDNPWLIRPEIPEGLNINKTKKPEKTLANSEFAGRLSGYINGVDYSLSAAYLWDDQPVYHLDGFELKPEHHRLGFVGLNMSRPMGDFVGRFEGAYFQGKYFEAENSSGLLEKDYIHAIGGFDWYPANNWVLSSQLAYKHILDYEGIIKNDKGQYTATFSVSKSFLRETLELENNLYYKFADKSGYNSFSADYAVTDNYHLKAGFDIFCGDKGLIGNYDDNDSIWIKSTYSF